MTTVDIIAAARELAREHLAEALPTRWQHVQAVAARAAEFAEGLDLQDPNLEAAAWLHDLGYSPRLVRCGFHPIDGARFLRSQSWPAPVVNLVAYHSCAIVEAERRGLADTLRNEFTDVLSPIRDALWAADATTGPDGLRLTIEQRVAEVASRYGEDSLVTQCMHSIAPELSLAYERTMSAVEKIKIAKQANFRS